MADAPRTILLVDDDITLSEMYAERLKAAGYNVLIAHDGEAGLVEAKKKPDLILLDIMMPKVNGLDALKSLKADPSTAHIPVILLTALIQELDKAKGVTAGAADYYVKSETMPGDLIKRIEKVMAGGAAASPAASGVASTPPSAASTPPPAPPVAPQV